ncbi:PAS domain-containing protein [Mucilaginibacter myungsuensis]|uniref:histidine kinase n=1 Tax=Mucilaginibacter myungsuensis TaxID=649104 RepID=A0A929L099_9SPHI|nr:PAS domain-containing protein [Mucilaginibacter myungsuensis]MBE9660931.1 PAS domain-containing protein [Mucilaginibacter myungsuensis]MDN3600977.1 PAS domain-containing protein [Mucilaginibacter myungsuensis]
MSIEPKNFDDLSTRPAGISLHPNEGERLAAVRSYRILDTAEEQDLDEITALASAICGTPVSLVTFLDGKRQWFKSHHGTDVTETPQEFAFCAHAVASSAPITIISDLTKDDRFTENPLVHSDPHVVFYAGVPLVDRQGYGLGTLCVVDMQPRELNELQISTLKVLAKQVVDKLEARRKVFELEASNQKLYESENRFRGLVSQAPVAIAIYAGSDKVIEDVNQEMLDILGRGSEIIGMPLLKARPELEGHPYMDVINSVFAEGETHRGEGVKVPVLSNGQLREGYFDVTYKPILNDEGTVISVMVVAIEVTEKVLLSQREAELGEELMAANEELMAANEELIASQENLIAINHYLTESEGRFRDLIVQAPIAIAIYSKDDLIIEQANDTMLAIWGRDSSVIGKPLLQARPEIVGHPFVGYLSGILATGEEKSGQSIKAVLPRGDRFEERYFDATYKPIKDRKGAVTGVIVVAIDVTERYHTDQREAEFKEELAAMNEELTDANRELTLYQDNLLKVNDVLSESESRFKHLIMQAPVAIATLRGRELVVTKANDMILEIWGKDNSVVGKPLHIALPELQGQPFLQILDDVFTSGEAFVGSEAQVSLYHEGSLKDMFVNFVYKPITINGETTDIMVVAVDVTEQVNARKDVEEANIRFNIALDASGLGSTEVELSTGVMTSTKQFKKNYGRAEDEVFNYPDLFDSMLPEYRDEVKRRVADAIADNSVYQAEYEVVWPDGSIHWISAHGRPRYDANGKAIRMVGMTADITEQKLQERRKDDFLSIASHELKTPTTSLKAALQLLNLIKDKPTSPMHVRLIEQSNRSMDRMTTLIDDLLNVNSMKEGQLKLDKSLFTVSHMLNACCSHVRLAGKHELIFEGDADLQVIADEHRIDQVVINLVNNAVKYAPDSQDIYLIAERFGDVAKVSVRDTGLGIPKDKLPFLFDRYYRADHTGYTYSGLGLGLYICSEIIKRHGGEIGVDSEVGKGSTFWFTLPL